MADKKKQKFRRSLQGTNGEEFHLESYLWDSANILRGHIDASDFKAYIFPLLFYKRISDVYDEEYQKALDESDSDVEYAESEVNHRFQIPKGYHWNDLRKKSKNIGQYLQKSLRSIEKANPETLFGIFGDTNWGDTDTVNDELMVNLVEHFSKITLSNSKIKDDLFGDSYEYLIKRFADLQNKKAGEFYTPRSVINMLIKILDPNDDDTICDPACGTGGMLLESINHIKRKKQDIRKLKLFGQELNLNTSSMAKVNLLLRGVDDFRIIRDDTLRRPAFHEKNLLTKFDYVIANPPFSLEEWGHEVWEQDPYGRVFAGLPPKGFGDFAWVQHMISSIKQTGTVGVILSGGALVRKSEKKIRQNIIENDLLEAIIQLGPDIFYGTTTDPCILIFKNKKKPSEKNNVFFINASEIYESGRGQNYLNEKQVDEILEIYQNRKDIRYKSKITRVPEIKKHNWNLSTYRYIDLKLEKMVPIKKLALELKNSIHDFQKSEKNLTSLIEKSEIIE